MNILDFLKSKGINDYKSVLGQNSSVEESLPEIVPSDDPMSLQPSTSIPINDPRTPIIPKIEPGVQKDAIPVNDIGYEIGTKEEYEKALQKSKEDRAFARLTENAAKLGSSIGGLISGGEASKVDNSIYKQAEEDAMSPLSELSAKIKLQDTDPKSAKSVAYKDYLKKLGFPVSENASYETLKGLLPEVSKKFDRELDREYKKQEFSLKRQELSVAKDNKQEDKNLQWMTNVATKTNKLSEGLDNATSAKERALSAQKGTAAELTILYDFIKSLDSNSAVREGEIGLARSLSSVMGNLGLTISKLGKTGVLPDETFKQIKSEINRLYDQVRDVYKRKVGIYHKQASDRGISEDRFDRFDPYYEKLKLEDSENKQKSSFIKKYQSSHKNATKEESDRAYELAKKRLEESERTE